MLAACTATQKPYQIGSGTQAVLLSNTASDTPGGACQLHISLNFNKATIVGLTANHCVADKQNTHFPIIKVCEPYPTSGTYDYALGGAFWAFGFTGVMLMYFSSHLIGLVLKAVRNG